MFELQGNGLWFRVHMLVCLSRSVEWSLRPLARRGCLKAAASTLRPEGQCPCMFRTFMPFAIVHASSGKLRLTFTVKLTCCLMKGMISSNNVFVSSYLRCVMMSFLRI